VRGGSAQGREGGDVSDAQERIARRLNPQQRGGLCQRRAHRRLVAKIDELDLPFAAAPPGVKQPVVPP